MTKVSAETRKLAAENRSRVALAFADNKTPYDVDGIAELLGLSRDVVNLAAPWGSAELDATNSDVYEVWLEGDDTVWEHRDSPEYFDDDGNPCEVVKPHRQRAHLRARSEEEAGSVAIAMHPGMHTLVSVENLSDKDG